MLLKTKGAGWHQYRHRRGCPEARGIVSPRSRPDRDQTTRRPTHRLQATARRRQQLRDPGHDPVNPALAMAADFTNFSRT
jgi:hypothetical protein